MKKLLSCAAALLLLLGTEAALADRGDRDGWERERDNAHYDRHDNGRGWAWGRRDRDDRGRSRDRDRDRVSVNLNFGNVYPDWRYRDYRRATSGRGIAYTTTWSAPSWGAPVNVRRYTDRRPVIINQNTYINQAPHVVTRPGRNSTSLYRDINGRCYERYIDSRGRETRTELHASDCNF